MTPLNYKDINVSEAMAPSPEAGSGESPDKLFFVVQKHDATHLHYDFRLEWDGVLKSWAVPKGPSMNPKERRLAVLVEDHELEYAGFQGSIPDGEYGAGTVVRWDHGTWKPLEGFTDVGKALQEGLLDFELNGKILRGGFSLIRPSTSYRKNGWLLVKKKDSHAVKGPYDANTIDPAG